MAHVIHLRCDRCGGPADGRSLWIRCTQCGTTLGCNFSNWMESPAYLEFQRNSMLDPQGYVRRWNHHEAELNRAVRLLQSSPAEAKAIAAEQAEFVLQTSSWFFPPQVLDDPDLRLAYRHWLGFELLHHRMPGRIRDLYGRLNEATAAIGFGANENPLPAFERMLEVLRELVVARYELGSPPDPEGLSVQARTRLQASTMVVAYLRLVSPELQVALLKAVFGEDAVQIGGGSQDYSVYFDWECPQCGLFSPQGVGSDSMTCPGCYCSRPFEGSPMQTGAIAAVCHGCGSRVEIPERGMLAACGYCTSQIKRFTRAGDAHRALVAEMKARVAAQYGFDPKESTKPSNGLGVTPANRMDRLRDGLVRIAQWYHQFLTPTRYLGFARASLPGQPPQSIKTLLQSARELALREGSGECDATRLIDKAAAMPVS